MSGLLCIGHRGACGHEPENTLRSVRRALELGAHGIEVDVRTVDGELVVIHDATLNRTTNGRGYIARKSFIELRELDAGHGERIPTLREVFETIDRRAFINVELKGRRTVGMVCALIEEFVGTWGWSYDDFLVSSFHRRELAQITNRQIRIGLLLARPSLLYHFTSRRLRAWSVNVALRYTSQPFVEDAHRRGLKVFVYTVNAPADISRMHAIGVDGIFTDYPERACGASRADSLRNPKFPDPNRSPTHFPLA